MATPPNSYLSTIKVSDIAKCRDYELPMDDGIRQAAINLIEKGHLTLFLNEIPSFIDQHMEPLFPVGSIHCLNRFAPNKSRCCIIARGHQKRERLKLEEREVYAILPLVENLAAPSTATTEDAEPQVVDEDGIVHVVLRSAVLPLPLWDVGKNVYVSGAGIEVIVQVKGRRFRGDVWEYSLFEDGEWDTEQGFKMTFDTVSSLDNPPPMTEESGDEEGLVSEEAKEDGDDKDKAVLSDSDEEYL